MKDIDKIYIRPLRLEDAQVSCHWRNNPKIWRHTFSTRHGCPDSASRCVAGIRLGNGARPVGQWAGADEGRADLSRTRQVNLRDFQNPGDLGKIPVIPPRS